MEKAKRFHLLSFEIGVVVGVIIAFSLAALAVKNSGWFVRRPPEANPMLTEGFNFGRIRDSDYNWRGPHPGEKINLSSLKNSEGKSLAETASSRKIMLVTLDPECAFCNISGDLINSVREGLKPVEIEYYPISFARFENPQSIEQYAASLGFQSKTFTWAKEGEPPQESLRNIVTPSHLLLDGNGKVIQVWAGSSQEKTDRDRISRQIIADIDIINDTMAALEQK